MGTERRTIGFGLLGLLVVVAVAAAVLGVMMSKGGAPAPFVAAARASLAAPDYSATVTVRTSETSDQGRPAPANGSQTYLFTKSVGSTAPVAVTQYFTAMLQASGVQRSGPGSPYVFTAPAVDFRQPGLPVYTSENFPAHVSVTVSGGLVRSVDAVVTANPEIQTQHLVVTYSGS